MLYFSSLLRSPEYQSAAENLFSVLKANGVKYDLLPNTRDIWLRDFMPVQCRDDSFVSFRYEPSYLENDLQLRTDFRNDMSERFPFPVTYSNIVLDGGNVVFSPSKERAIISDRVFWENGDREKAALIRQLERELKAQIIIIPSLLSDMTGHADGMVRFADDCTALVNRTSYKNGLEQRIRKVLEQHGITILEFPYFFSARGSAVGCYLNFLETERHIFLPVFDSPADDEAVKMAERIFAKTTVPVNIGEIAQAGGCLNCISWKIEPRDTVEYRL